MVHTDDDIRVLQCLNAQIKIDLTACHTALHVGFQLILKESVAARHTGRKLKILVVDRFQLRRNVSAVDGFFAAAVPGHAFQHRIISFLKFCLCFSGYFVFLTEDIVPDFNSIKIFYHFKPENATYRGAKIGIFGKNKTPQAAARGNFEAIPHKEVSLCGILGFIRNAR